MYAVRILSIADLLLTSSAFTGYVALSRAVSADRLQVLHFESKRYSSFTVHLFHVLLTAINSVKFNWRVNNWLNELERQATRKSSTLGKRPFNQMNS